MTQNAQQSPFLRNQRNFPQDSTQSLTVEINKAYIDIAQKVNDRTIGIFPLNSFVTTGNIWYLTGPTGRQPTLRQVYTFSAAGSIAHGINLSQIGGFVQIYGTFTDGTNWYPLPYVDIVAANQISVYVDPTNIVITNGGGAPSITSGYVVLEWLAL